MKTPLRVLVVDDSAVVRQVLTSILTQAGMEVATAPDPVIALQKIERSRPDVVTLDIEMPRMDGLTFLRRVMSEQPLPVVVCSGLAESGSEVALRALEEGALDVIEKPKVGLKGFLEDSAARLVHVVRAAAAADLSRSVRRRAPGAPATAPGRPAAPPEPASSAIKATTHKVAVIGASTGGTEALRVVLEALPPDAPGIAIVQHMPEYFTGQFAKRLDQSCRIEVKEAAPGDRLVPGRALIAPGNRHLVVRRTGALYVTDLVDGERVGHHRPSVDVLFHSAAEACGRNVMGVILTGMGADGADGMLAMRQAGAFNVAQDEATSVVFGMPKEAIAAGGVDEVLPLERIASAIVRWAR
ncbi:MAG: chemotaxis response regulator protein-glutamate methylesterase [Anaeromyxobacteraceae bacterium]